ncbi:MAG TPA: hypothetical protein VFT64_04275 [Rickettsiales bacterium]|nr:hypothetical protein [Rickettsiales bacterium]
MRFTQTIDGTLELAIGKEGAGAKEFSAALEAAAKAVGVLQGHKKDNSWPVLNCAEWDADLPLIESTAKRICDEFETLVVLGMGASSRGGNTLVALAQNAFTGRAGGKKIHFIENIDPFTFENLRAALDLKTTLFLAISKSGGTAETMAQLLVLLKEVEDRLGAAAVKKHFLFVTEPGKNSMRRIGEERGIEMIEHDPNVGGRFSALTVVGLLPAKVAGLDIRAVRQGAAEVIRDMFNAPQASAPVIGAALHDVLLKKGKTVSVFMPYCDRLDALGAWHQQLWEESLGKSGRGTTLLRALGAVDQHSQLQLYLDGPRDKFVTLLLLAQKGTGAPIPPSQDTALGYLKNHTVGDLMEAEQDATCKTLIANNCPTRVFKIEKLDEAAIGALMMHFMLETMITAHLWDIEAFGQPAVEQSKQLARQYLENS